MLRFGPANNDEVAAYDAFYSYLSTRDRSAARLKLSIFLARGFKKDINNIFLLS